MDNVFSRELWVIRRVTSYGFRDMWSEENTQTGIVLPTFTLSFVRLNIEVVTRLRCVAPCT